MPRSSTAIRGEHRTSGFSPTAVPNLRLWLDAGQITGGTNNAALATWQDRSGGGRDYANATPATEPTYMTSGTQLTPTGKPVVYFPANALLTSAAALYAAGDSATVFCVSAWVSAASANTMIKMPGGLDTSWSTASPRTVRYDKFGVVNLGDGGSAANVLTGVFAQTAIQWVSGVSSSLWINGTNYINASATTAVSDAPGTATVGGQGAITIAEMIFYNRALTTAERQQIEGYLRTKHGTP